MPTVLHMAVKDLVLVSRDRLGLFFIIGFPILIGLFFGFISGSFEPESAELGIAVIDDDESGMSARFLKSLDDSASIQTHQLARPDALDRVRRGQLVAMLVIPAGFGETAGMIWTNSPAIELGIDPSRSAETGMLKGLVMQAAGELAMIRFRDPATMRPFIDRAQKEMATADDIPSPLRSILSSMMSKLDEFIVAWADVVEAENEEQDASAGDGPKFEIANIKTIDVTREIPAGSTAALVEQIRSPWDISFPQSMLWGVLACAAGFAVSMVRERKFGTFLRLQVAPVSRAQILIGKGLACFIAVLGVISVMVVLGLWLGLRPRSPLLLSVAAVCVAFCFVGIMMMMSVVGRSEEAVAGAAWGANMIMAMFGGCMLPLAFMPGFMKVISHFSPAKWSILALEGAIWRGFSVAEMFTPCAILLAIGTVGMIVGTRVLSRIT